MTECRTCRIEIPEPLKLCKHCDRNFNKELIESNFLKCASDLMQFHSMKDIQDALTQHFLKEIKGIKLSDILKNKQLNMVEENVSTFRN